MKRMSRVFLALLLLVSLAACSSDDGDGGKADSSGGAATGTSAGGLTGIIRLPANRAAERISEFNGLATSDCLLAVKNYGDAIGWVEVNQIERLERLDHTAVGAYVLLTPRFVGSRILVESLDAGGTPNGTLYELAETPDDYALIVNSTMPATPDMQVTVTCDAGSATFLFTGIGGGEEALPLRVDGVYYTVPGRVADLSAPAGQTDGRITGMMAVHNDEGADWSVLFALTLPDGCTQGESDGRVQTLYREGYEVSMTSYLLDGEADAIIRAVLGGDPVEVDAAAGLFKTDARADAPAYAFAHDELVVVVGVSWMVPELDPEWDDFARALADGFSMS